MQHVKQDIMSRCETPCPEVVHDTFVERNILSKKF